VAARRDRSTACATTLFPQRHSAFHINGKWITRKSFGRLMVNAQPMDFVAERMPLARRDQLI
jgi:hypothetical protein